MTATSTRKMKQMPKHDERNAYRPKSGYALLVNLTSAQPATKEQILKRYVAITGVAERLAKFSWQVVSSARTSVNSTRHKSAKTGYYISKGKDGLLHVHFGGKKGKK